MRKIILLIGVAAGLSGCADEAVKRRELAEADYYARHYSSYRTRDCVTEHLNAMSDADSVQKWDAALYDSVARECDKLFLDAEKPAPEGR